MRIYHSEISLSLAIIFLFLSSANAANDVAKNSATNVASSVSKNKSFFLSNEESEKALKLIHPKKNEENFQLSGILYINSETWTIWINGQAYSTIGHKKDFSIQTVQKEKAIICLPNGASLTLSVSSKES